MTLVFPAVGADGCPEGYGSDVVVIGGWPVLSSQEFSHATENTSFSGCDLALNFRGIPEEAYETLLETIRRLATAAKKYGRQADSGEL